MDVAVAQGEHPKHKGVKDPALLGTVERYFAEMMGIPRLQQRIHCFMFSRTFPSTLQQVGAYSQLPTVSTTLSYIHCFMFSRTFP